MSSDCRSIVLITIDDLRYDGVFENEDASRPRFEPLRKLASDGIVCTRMFSNASGTKRSFPGMFSGCHYYRFGGETEYYEDERPHLAEDLQERGYHTAGLHSNPFLNEQYKYDRGFNRFNPSLDTEISQDLRSRFVQKVTDQITRNDFLFGAARKTISLIGSTVGIDPRGQPYADADTITNQAISILESLEEPMFMWVHYMDVHSPWHPHPNTRSEGVSEREAIAAFHRYRRDPEGIDEETMDLLKRLYYGEVEYLMPRIDELLATVDETCTDPIVLLVSDHGEAFGEHGYYRHPWGLHNELTHVPCLVGGLGYNETEVVSSPTSTLDVRPTLLEAAGGPPAERCDGIPLQEQIGTNRHSRRVVSMTGPPDSGKVSITDGRWKLIRNSESGEIELYDLRDDYEEQDNLADSHPERRRDMVSELETTIDEMHAEEKREQERKDLSESAKRRLEHLGYADDIED